MQRKSSFLFVSARNAFSTVPRHRWSVPPSCLLQSASRASNPLSSRSCGGRHLRPYASAADATTKLSGKEADGLGKKEEVWIDPPHIAAAKERLRTFEKEDHYTVLGVAPDADSDSIITAYNERGAALASTPDFCTNAELKAQLQRLKQATEVLLDPLQRLEFDAQRRSVHEALRRLEVDPNWARGKQRMATVGRKFLFTKQLWAFGVFLAMMGAFTYIAIDLTRRKEEQLKLHDRSATTRNRPHGSHAPTPSPAAVPSAETEALTPKA